MTKTNQPNKALESIILNSTKVLENVGVESARLDVLMLMEIVLAKSRAYILANQSEHYLTDTQLASFDSLLDRRIAKEPIAYIVGHTNFYGLDIQVNKHVLVPRPETEDIVELAINNTPRGAKILDVGTGSGAIAVSIGVNRPDLLIFASDISDKALKIARQNALKYNLHDIKFINSDIMHDINDKFDVILANLPYIPTGRSHVNTPVFYEPNTALYSGEDGLDHYRHLFRELRFNNQITRGFTLLIEAEPTQHDELIKIAKDHGLTHAETVRLTLQFTA